MADVRYCGAFGDKADIGSDFVSIQPSCGALTGGGLTKLCTSNADLFLPRRTLTSQ